MHFYPWSLLAFLSVALVGFAFTKAIIRGSQAPHREASLARLSSRKTDGTVKLQFHQADQRIVPASWASLCFRVNRRIPSGNWDAPRFYTCFPRALFLSLRIALAMIIVYDRSEDASIHFRIGQSGHETKPPSGQPAWDSLCWSFTQIRQSKLDQLTSARNMHESSLRVKTDFLRSGSVW